MDLPKSTLNELKKLRIDYEKREKVFDIDFILAYFDLVNGTSLFNDSIAFSFVDNPRVSAYENCGVVTVSIEGLKRQAMQILSVFTELYTPETEYRIKNLFALLALAHETSHVAQSFGLDPDEVVNEFYRALNSRAIMGHVVSVLSTVCSFFSDISSFERHANIDAHKALIDIYDDSPLGVIPKTFYLDLILYQYGLLSPTEKTQSLFLLPRHFDYESLSIMKRLEVGFPVDKSIITAIDNELIREARGDINFSQCKERILGITNGIKY